MHDDFTRNTAGCIYTCAAIYLIAEVGWLAALVVSESESKDFIYTILVITTILLFLLFGWYIDKEKDKAQKEAQSWKDKASRAESDYKLKSYALEKDFKKKENEFRQIEQSYYSAVKSKTPFSHVAEMFSNWESVCYDNVAYFLRHKSHPAIKKAETIDELKEKFRVIKRSEKEMKYKYLFLLDTFPELKRYVDDEESLLHLSDYKDYEEFREERDEVLDYINAEEYKAMSVTQRNQLALDRFKRGNKSDWQIGMLYEMYIGHLLKQNQFTVDQYGIKNGLEDLGRDIIAQRVENGVRKIYIIQCKNWSKKKEIHENVVCQLFGTAMQYELANKGLSFQETEIIPLLVVTNQLSDTAKKFADKLGVKYSIRPMKDFPMIKCNINQGSKIYHLPFDQQYYRTQIKLKGEFYAMTVEEAEKAGFRRARRHMFNKS